MDIREIFSEKEIKIFKRKKKLRKFIIIFLSVVFLVIIISSFLYFRIAYIYSSYENIENITSVIGSNIDVNKTYSGRVVMINYCSCMGVCALILGIFCLSNVYIIIRDPHYKMLLKFWKLTSDGNSEIQKI